MRFGPHAVPLDPGNRPGVRGRVVLGIRPEAFEDGALAPAHLPRIAVQVDVLEELGADTHVCFRVDAPRPDVEIGVEDDEATLLASDATLFTARLDPQTRARQGDALELAAGSGEVPLLRRRRRPRAADDGARRARRGRRGTGRGRRVDLTTRRTAMDPRRQDAPTRPPRASAP